MVDPSSIKLFVQDRLPIRFWSLGKSVYYWVRAIPCMGGNQVTCPCCGHSLRRFVAFRGRPVLCPWCQSLERHRLLYLYFQEHTNLFQDQLKVLYFAPDALERKLRTSPNLTYISADLEDPHAMMKIDITAIPFPDASFDVILCSHVLEHVPDDRKAMSELYRVLKPSGWAILLVPFDSARTATFEDSSITDTRERERIFGQRDHVRIYGQDYVDRLKQAGFTVRQDTYGLQIDSLLHQKYGLPNYDDIFYCTHP